MAFQSCGSNPVCGSDISSLFDPFLQNLGGFNGVLRGGSAASQALVLDTERGELVKAPAGVGKKGASEAKSMAALKSHSEAERRRRERINAHLDTLRGLVPCTEKMDKATLLAEVINQVKELKKNAIEASKGHLIPTDADEVRVETCENGSGDGTFSVTASLCCDYRPELLSDLKQALDTLHLSMVKAEISTLGGRVKNVIVFSGSKEGIGDSAEACQLVATSIHKALSSVLDKVPTFPEYSPRISNKRRKISFFDSSSSSS